jgi:hypothetical protein
VWTITEQWISGSLEVGDGRDLHFMFAVCGSHPNIAQNLITGA